MTSEPTNNTTDSGNFGDLKYVNYIEFVTPVYIDYERTIGVAKLDLHNDELTIKLETSINALEIADLLGQGRLKGVSIIRDNSPAKERTPKHVE